VTRFHCPCCGYPTLDEEPPGTHVICAVCFWEDDRVQFDDPTFRGGANKVSLNDARASFEAYGACDDAGRAHVRPPTDDEIRGRN
jgi:hypothetical protein